MESIGDAETSVCVTSGALGLPQARPRTPPGPPKHTQDSPRSAQVTPPGLHKNNSRTPEDPQSSLQAPLRTSRGPTKKPREPPSKFQRRLKDPPGTPRTPQAMKIKENAKEFSKKI